MLRGPPAQPRKSCEILCGTFGSKLFVSVFWGFAESSCLSKYPGWQDYGYINIIHASPSLHAFLKPGNEP